MAASSYEQALRRLLAHEGGYTNHPSDPGGPRNFGITIHDYRKYVKPGATAADVRTMRLEEAKAIYAPNTGMPSAATNCQPASITPWSTTESILGSVEVARCCAGSLAYRTTPVS
jgi:hypothetical protein